MTERSLSSSAGKTKYKIILLGDQSTGKSSIIERFMHDKFSERANPTIGIDFLGKNLSYKGKDYRLQLWDTAGQEKFRSLIPSYLKDAICVMYVFDLNNIQSLANMQRWVQLFKQNKGMITVSILCGNKLDLDKHVSKTQIDNFLQKNRMSYFQISAKTGQNIDKMFESIIDIINQQLNKYKKPNVTNNNQTQIDEPPLTRQPFVNNNNNNKLTNNSTNSQGGTRRCCSS